MESLKNRTFLIKTLLRVLGCMYLTTDTSATGIKFFAWTFFTAEVVNTFVRLIEILNSEKLEE